MYILLEISEYLPCYYKKFSINMVKGKVEEFGEIDYYHEPGDPSCTIKFIPKELSEKEKLGIMNKYYFISEEEINEVMEYLKSRYSGRCNYCDN